MGGDFQLSELMGYAGDGRLDAAGTTYLVAEDDRGLDPPKIAVEFDTRTNNAVGDPPPDYCADASTANFDTRNDPLASNKDAVQYVFWGRTSSLTIPCRDNNTLYDDNRHDADGEEATEEWRFGMGGAPSLWRPAIGPDGTIYASDQVDTLYAFDEDGSVKWTFNLTDGNVYMPGVDPDTGTIYSDIFGSALVAVNPDGTEKWRYVIAPATDIDSTPVVDPFVPNKGNIYFGTEQAQALIALDSAGNELWRLTTGGAVDTVPALSPDGTAVYFVANDNNLYAANKAARLAGLPFPQPGEWTFPIDTDPGEVNSSPTVNPSDGTIYVGSSDDHSTFAINPDGTLKWQFNPGTGSDMESSPTFAINPVNGIPTVYIGSDDDNLYAINANNGNELWRFDTGSQVVSSPIVDLDGTIYVGSDNGNVYAINPGGTQKWVHKNGFLQQGD
jgi:outer membrane protein assembly factor BamB